MAPVTSPDVASSVLTAHATVQKGEVFAPLISTKAITRLVGAAENVKVMVMSGLVVAFGAYHHCAFSPSLFTGSSAAVHVFAGLEEMLEVLAPVTWTPTATRLPLAGN